MGQNSLRRKNKAIKHFKTERFDNIDSAVIISSQFCTVLLTAESMLSKRSVLRITMTLFFLTINDYLHPITYWR